MSRNRTLNRISQPSTLGSTRLAWVRQSVLCAFALMSIYPAFSKETVYFKTGFSLEVESHAEQDEMMLFRIGSGTVQFPVEQVLRIESLPEAAPSQNVSRSRPPEPVIDEMLTQAAYAQGLEPGIVRSVAKIESDLRPNAISSKGAIGVMQLMPATAAGLGVDPAHPETNAQGGARYLRELLIRYHGNSTLALAAYNAGPGAVDKFGGVPPYAETKRYVLKVLREYQRQKKANAQMRSSKATNNSSATN